MDSQQKLELFSLAESLVGLGHWYVDLPNEKLYWSDQVYKIHGVTPEEYTPELSSAINFYHPDDRQRVTDYVGQAIGKGENFEFTLRLVQPSGIIRHVKSKGQCVKNDSGQVIKLFGVFIDVSDEVEARNKNEKMELAHDALVDTTDDGYWDWRIQEDYEYMSPRFWRMFGYEPEEKPHKPSAWQDMIFPEDLQLALENFEKHVESRGKHPYSLEVRYRHKDGSTVTVLCRGKVVEWDGDGKPLRMIGTHTNITHLKETEEVLQAHLSFQRLLMNVNTDLIFVKDEKFRIVSANEAFLSIYPPELRDKVIGSTTLEAYPPEEVEQFLEEDKKAFREGMSEVIEKITMPSGSSIILFTKKVRFENSDGQPFILGVARDVTELKETEMQLKRANEELEAFAYRTSHDLRSPLVSSNRLLKFIKEDIAKGKLEKAERHIDLVRSSLDGLDSLVSDLLDLTKIEHDTAIESEVNVKELVDAALKKLSYLEGFSRTEISTHFEGHSTTLMDKDLIRQVVENLVSNAIKYQDPEVETGFVDVNVCCDDQFFELSVSDNGLGIPEKFRDRLFTMFNRFHSNVAFGSGLGLYMIRKTVEKLEGDLDYEPLEQGSKFTVKIPAKQNVETRCEEDKANTHR